MADAPDLLDPAAVLRLLADSGAWVELRLSGGSELEGRILTVGDEVAVVHSELDGTASFVRLDAVGAVTVREAMSFADVLRLPRRGAPIDTTEPVPAAVAGVGAGPGLAGGPSAGAEVESALRQALQTTGFGVDGAALAAASPAAQAGLLALLQSVDAALQSIVADPAANAAMQKDVQGVRLLDGAAQGAAIQGTTLVVTSPWQGPAYDPTALRDAILAAAS